MTLDFADGGIRMKCMHFRAGKAALLQELSPGVLQSEYFDTFGGIGREAQSFSHDGCRERRGVGGVGENTIDSLLPGDLIYCFDICRTGPVEPVCNILSGVIRKIVAHDREIPQLFGGSYGDRLLCRTS